MFRGAVIRSLVTALGSLGWIGVDVWLDRLDVAGWTALLWTAAVAIVVVCVAGLAGRWRTTGPNRWVLTLAAAVAASLSITAAFTTSPTGTERSLNLSAMAMGGVLAALAVGCALGTVEPLPRGWTLLATALTLATTGAVVAIRILWSAGYEPHSQLLRGLGGGRRQPRWSSR